MSAYVDGPATPAFRAVSLGNSRPVAAVLRDNDSKELINAITAAPAGGCVFRGLPFAVDGVVRVGSDPVTLEFQPVTAKWIVFLHASDVAQISGDKTGIISPMKGAGMLNDPAGTYTIHFTDGSSQPISLARRHQVSAYSHRWGENTVRSVPSAGPSAVPQPHEQARKVGNQGWGMAQTRVSYQHYGPWTNQLYAWENPTPDIRIASIECQATTADLFIFGLSVGTVETNPLRWERRRKALINLAAVLPSGEEFDPVIGENGQLSQVAIDLGTIISAMPQRIYPADDWASGHNNRQPELSNTTIAIEYTAHPDARIFVGEHAVAVADLDDATGSGDGGSVSASDGSGKSVAIGIGPSHHRVRIRVVEKGSTVPVPVKLHVHGAHGEYLAPVDRHRIPNHAWLRTTAPTSSTCLPAVLPVPAGCHWVRTTAPISGAKPSWMCRWARSTWKCPKG
ncbi:MAG: hypothetical protein E4H09_04425, partial [Spirochaetales bacterium]